MTTNPRVAKLIADFKKSMGDDVGVASETLPPRWIPSGVLSLDYALGGGIPTRHITNIFGPKDIGKSVLAMQTVASVQRMGEVAAWIAVEPNFDPAWAERHGVNTEELFIARPRDGEAAFTILHKLVNSGEFSLIVFDSLGALLSASEVDEKGKMKAGGQAGLITWGIKRIWMPTYRNDVSVILLNQIRDKMNSQIPGLVSQPGGHAVEHASSIICQLKRGPNTEIAKIRGDEIQIAHEVVATIHRNKLKEGSRQKAHYMFYNMEVPDKPFGVDWFSDLLATGQRTGVITRGGGTYYYGDEKFRGGNELHAYLLEHPAERESIRTQILNMLNDGSFDSEESLADSGE